MTAQFPSATYTARDTENLPGIVYDANEKRNMFSEDFQNQGAEITAIETFLRGQATLLSVPTSPAGLTAGQVWCDTAGGLNILKIII